MNENALIIKNSVLLYIRLIIVSIVTLLASRFILHALGASDFGLYHVVGGVVTMMAFVNVVMISTTYRFIAFEIGRGDLENIKKIFNISFVIHLFIALIIIVFAFTFGIIYIKYFLNIPVGKYNDAVFVFSFSVFAAIITIVSVPLQGLLIAKEKFSITVPVEILKSIVNLLIIILVVYYTGNKLRLYAVLFVLVSAIPPVFYFLYCKKQFNEIITWDFQKDRLKYKEMVKFSGWIMFGAASNVGESQGSALMINYFFGTVLNAAFGIANQVNTVVKMFSQSLGQAIIPQITKSYSSGSIDRSLQLVIYASKYSFFLMLIPALPILLETDFILNVWLKDVPLYTKIFVQIMLLNALISSMSAGVSATVQATGNIKYFQIILGSIMLLGLPIAFFCFNLGFPPYSILWIYSLVALFSFIIQNLLLRKILHFDVTLYLKKSIIKIFFVSISVLPLFIIRSFFEAGLFRFVFMTCLAVIFVLFTVYLFGIEQNERNIIKQLKHKFFNKILS